MSLFYFFAVPPSKPVIRLGDSSGQSVEGYLGPYQIGTRLVLSCQVNGGKNSTQTWANTLTFTKNRRLQNFTVPANILLTFHESYSMLLLKVTKSKSREFSR